MYPIYFIDKGSRLLGRTYSMLVQQRPISRQEYEYWALIRKTTENLGGLFDPLPSQVTGNVHNEANSEETVLGYFSGAFVAEKRIFVTLYDLPDYLMTVEPWDFECELRFIPINQLDEIGGDVFVEQVGQPPTGFTAATQNCADCTTIGGGTSIPPSFWPQ